MISIEQGQTSKIHISQTQQKLIHQCFQYFIQAQLENNKQNKQTYNHKEYQKNKQEKQIINNKPNSISIPQKFKQIQLQVIQVIQHRVKLENYFEIQKIKQESIDKLCLMYQKIKQQSTAINQLAKFNSQLDQKYLIKVAQLSQQILRREKLQKQVSKLSNQNILLKEDINKISQELLQTVQMKRVNNSREPQENILTHNKNYLNQLTNKRKNIKSKNFKRIQRQEKGQLVMIQEELSSIKQLLKSISTLQTKENSLNGDLNTNQLSEMQNLVNYSRIQHNNEKQSKLQTQLSLNLQFLNIKKQMIDTSQEYTQKYMRSQQQLIQRLMNELISIKQKNQNQINSNSSIKGSRIIRSSNSNKNPIIMLQEQYRSSSFELQSTLQRQLMQMKQQVQISQQQKQRLQKVVRDLKREIQNMQNQRQSISESHREQIRLIVQNNNLQIQQIIKQKQIQKQKYERQLKRITQDFDNKQENLKQKIKQLQKLNNKSKQQIELLKNQINQIKIANQMTVQKLLNEISRKQAQIKQLMSQTNKIHQNSQQKQQSYVAQELQQNTDLSPKQLQKLRDSNTSLQNQKLLLKSLNKKLNKQVIESENKVKQLQLKINELEDKIITLESSIQDKLLTTRQAPKYNQKEQQQAELQLITPNRQKSLQQIQQLQQKLRELNQKEIHLEKIKSELQKRQKIIESKQNQQQQKQKQLEQIMEQIKLQQIYNKKQEEQLKQLKLEIQLEKDQPLSPPPSPYEEPQNYPNQKDNLSPFKLESADEQKQQGNKFTPKKQETQISPKKIEFFSPLKSIDPSSNINLQKPKQGYFSFDIQNIDFQKIYTNQEVQQLMTKQEYKWRQIHSQLDQMVYLIQAIDANI